MHVWSDNRSRRHRAQVACHVLLLFVASFLLGNGCGFGGSTSGESPRNSSTAADSAFLVGQIRYTAGYPDSVDICLQPDAEPLPTGAFPAEIFVFPAGSVEDTAYARPLAHLWTSSPRSGRIRRFRVSGLVATDTVDVVARAAGWDALKVIDLVLEHGRNEVILGDSSPLPQAITTMPTVRLRHGVAREDFDRLLASVGPEVAVQDTIISPAPFDKSRGPHLNVSVRGDAAEEPGRVAARLSMSPMVSIVYISQAYAPPCPTG